MRGLGSAAIPIGYIREGVLGNVDLDVRPPWASPIGSKRVSRMGAPLAQCELAVLSIWGPVGPVSPTCVDQQASSLD